MKEHIPAFFDETPTIEYTPTTWPSHVEKFDSRWLSWFEARNWNPLPFQKEMWRHYLQGNSGLLHTPTGSGKTLAAIGGPLLEALQEQRHEAYLKVLWVTPLRALANDTLRALHEPIEHLQLPWQIGMRTGDASARDKRLARAGKFDLLVITPESLALLLSYPETLQQLTRLRSIIVDEWHELLGNKRGVLLQLCLARLRGAAPKLKIWGLSATLGNIQQALDVLVPATTLQAPAQRIVVSGAPPKKITLQTLLPNNITRFPWAGHLGLSQLGGVIKNILAARTTLLFANTRAHAELWHQALSSVWLESPKTLALHHGSLDPKLRVATEQGLRDGSIRCVVATSSLDLGVDFPSVDLVIQIGSPKSAARILQRAGRAKHRPNEAGHILCVPTHALELTEFIGVRHALQAGHIEARQPPLLSLDVLAQHCVTLALAGGFKADALYAEVRRTYSYAQLSQSEWEAILNFIVQGGAALENYPDYRRVIIDIDGMYKVTDRRIGFRHRVSIGTITSEGSIAVKFVRGGTLGNVEESFIARLAPGEHFQFAGKLLMLVRLENMTAYVRLAKVGAEGTVPKWQGSRLPMSYTLSQEIEKVFTIPREEDAQKYDPELARLRDLLSLQARLSALPIDGTLLCEVVDARDGQHIFIYPFAGRQTHEGCAYLLALRLASHAPNTFTFAANDYGFVLEPEIPIEPESILTHDVFSEEGLLEDLRHSFNLNELARRQFREIARIAGLLPANLPGSKNPSTRQLQTSSGLIYDVLRRYDPDHILLAQAEREVLNTQLNIDALRHTLSQCRARKLKLMRPKTLTPLSFPLWADNLRGQLSTETWSARVQRAAQRLEKIYANPPEKSSTRTRRRTS